MYFYLNYKLERSEDKKKKRKDESPTGLNFNSLDST